MTAPRCACSIWANEPSRWCEKHGPYVIEYNARPRFRGAEPLHVARHRFALERPNPCAFLIYPVDEGRP